MPFISRLLTRVHVFNGSLRFFLVFFINVVISRIYEANGLVFFLNRRRSFRVAGTHQSLLHRGADALSDSAARRTGRL